MTLFEAVEISLSGIVLILIIAFNQTTSRPVKSIKFWREFLGQILIYFMVSIWVVFLVDFLGWL